MRCLCPEKNGVRGGRGGSYRKAKYPEKPLVMWGYELSPFTKFVREVLVELVRNCLALTDTFLDTPVVSRSCRFFRFTVEEGATSDSRCLIGWASFRHLISKCGTNCLVTPFIYLMSAFRIPILASRCSRALRLWSIWKRPTPFETSLM